MSHDKQYQQRRYILYIYTCMYSSTYIVVVYVVVVLRILELQLYLRIQQRSRSSSSRMRTASRINHDAGRYSPFVRIHLPVRSRSRMPCNCNTDRPKNLFSLFNIDHLIIDSPSSHRHIRLHNPQHVPYDESMAHPVMVWPSRPRQCPKPQLISTQQY